MNTQSSREYQTAIQLLRSTEGRAIEIALEIQKHESAAEPSEAELAETHWNQRIQRRKQRQQIRQAIGMSCLMSSLIA